MNRYSPVELMESRDYTEQEKCMIKFWKKTNRIKKVKNPFPTLKYISGQKIVIKGY